MTKSELISRLKGYEWTDFECKKAQSEVPKDAYSTVSAFSNTQGGWLIFGVSDNAGMLEITGVDPNFFDRVQNAFLTTLRSGQKVNRIIHAEPYVYEIEGNRILAFFIPEMERHQKPVYLNGNPRESFIRRAARDERMTDNELQCFMRDAAEKAWDSAIISDLNPDTSIDRETLDWYREQFYRRNPEQRYISDPKEFLREWNFIVHHQGKPHLTRAAILLFGADHHLRSLLPRPVLDYQRIDTRFAHWSADERWHDRVVFEENLFKTWRGLVAKYSRIAEHPFKIDPATLRRIDDPPDYVAFREAAINLLIHQDFGDHHRKASIKWFTDQVHFWNPGDAFASPAQLLESNEKEIRNPLIVNAFRRIGLSDQAGTGIPAIVRNWHKLGHCPPQILNCKAKKQFQLILIQEPLITEPMRRFQASLGVKLSPQQADVLAIAANQETLSRMEAAMATGGNLKAGHDTVRHLVRQQLLQALDEDTFALANPIAELLAHWAKTGKGEDPASARQVTDKYPTSARQVVEALLHRGEDMTRAELQKALNLADREHFSKAYLQPALKNGLVEMTIPDKPTSSKQKYRLTAKGREILELE